MTYTLLDWVSDMNGCIAWCDLPQSAEARVRLERHFATTRPSLSEPNWTIDRILVAYLWFVRHARELDIPAALVGKEEVVPSRYLWEALYRVCMRMHDAGLHRDIDVALVMKLSVEQKALDP